MHQKIVPIVPSTCAILNLALARSSQRCLEVLRKTRRWSQGYLLRCHASKAIRGPLSESNEDGKEAGVGATRSLSGGDVFVSGSNFQQQFGMSNSISLGRLGCRPG